MRAKRGQGHKRGDSLAGDRRSSTPRGYRRRLHRRSLPTATCSTFPLPFFFSSSCLHTSKLFHYLFCLLFPPLFPGIDFSGDTDGSAITLNASAVICQFALVGTLTLSPLVWGVLLLGLEKSSSSSLFLSSHRTDR